MIGHQNVFIKNYPREMIFGDLRKKFKIVKASLSSFFNFFLPLSSTIPNFWKKMAFKRGGRVGMIFQENIHPGPVRHTNRRTRFQLNIYKLKFSLFILLLRIATSLISK